jgi:hypothetical protein
MNTSTFYFSHCPAAKLQPGQTIELRPFSTPVMVVSITCEHPEQTNSNWLLCYQGRSDTDELVLDANEMIKLVGGRYGVELTPEFLPTAQLVEMLNASGGVMSMDNNVSTDEHGPYLNTPVSAPGLTFFHDHIKLAYETIRANELPFTFVLKESGYTVADMKDDIYPRSHQGFAPHSMSNALFTGFAYIDDNSGGGERKLPQVTYAVSHSGAARGSICHTDDVSFIKNDSGWKAQITPSHDIAHTTLSSCAAHLGTKLIAVGLGLQKNAGDMDSLNFNSLRAK